MNKYTRYYKMLLKGASERPRGLPTHAVYNVVYEYMPGEFPRRPHDNPAIGLMEGLQFIAGMFSLEAIQKVAPNAKLSLFTGQSAYGPRVGAGGMCTRVIDELTNDLWSRRAIVMINHQDDTAETEPCTVSMQFFANGGRWVSSTTTMRSSDAIWGLPYDLIQFGMVTRAVAEALNPANSLLMQSTHIPESSLSLSRRVGASAVMIGNAHVYESTALKQGESFRTWKFNYPLLGPWTVQAKAAADIIKSVKNGYELMHDVFNIEEVR